MQCQRCNQDNPSSARFCSGCGNRLERHCPACGSAAADDQSFCSACGAALGPVEPDKSAADEGERRQATIVFSDLSGYTALNERLDPEEVERLMSRIKQEATRIVEKHGGMVNQFVGDQVVALFGVPMARRDDPQRAVRASLEIHRAVNALCAENPQEIVRCLTMHTGINSGLIVTRRSDQRGGRYTITGDTVNTGARLQSLAGADEIVVSQDTWRQISDQFQADAAPPIEVKGKERPVTPYRIRGERAPTEVARRAFVGRTDETGQFAALARACLERQTGRIIVVRGDPGIGKSRLAREFLAIAQGLAYACHSALVLDFAAESGRDPVRSLARSLLGVEADADDSTRLEAVEQALASASSHGNNKLFLCDLMNIAPPAELRSIHAAMTNQTRDRGTTDTMCDLVRAAARHRGAVLLVEDVHWADAWTLEKLGSLVRLTAETPLLLVLTTRFQNDPTAGEWRGALHGAPVTGIDLAPLGVEDALRMAGEYGTLPESLARSYAERAAGNPLFLEQLLLNMEESSQTNLPGSIHALVLARMDRLPPADRHAMQAAALLGQRFSLQALRHVLENPGYECRALLEHYVVRAEGLDFLFSHALIRDGAYESVLKSRRRELHCRAAEWFRDREPAFAAEHLERAEHPDAVRAYLAASQAESTRYRYSAALALAERGLALASTREDKYALSTVQARVLHDSGRAPESIDAYRRALETAEGPADRCRALIGMASGMRIVDDVEPGLACLAEAEPLGIEAKLALELSELYHLRGNLYFGQGRPQDCLREHEKALELAREAGSVEAEANALSGLGDANYVMGRMRTAHEHFARSVDIAVGHGLGRIEAANRHMMGWSAYFLNRLRYALEIGRDSIELAKRVSHQRTEILARHLVVCVEALYIGELRDATAHLDIALEHCRALGAKRFESQNHTYRAMIALREGDRDRARELARAAVEFCREHGMKFIGPTALGVLAQLTTDASERAALNAEAMALLAEGAISHNNLWFHRGAIESALERSEWDEAETYCAALEAYTSSEPLPQSDLLIARGRALASFGRGVRSEALTGRLRQILREAEECEFNPLVPALRAAIGEAERTGARSGISR